MILQEAVTTSRKKYATQQPGDSVQSMITFNHELLLCFQQRRRNGKGQTNKEKKPTPKHAMCLQNTFDDFSDEDDDDIEDSASVARDSLFGSITSSNRAAV